jgi:hypothetical protein
VAQLTKSDRTFTFGDPFEHYFASARCIASLYLAMFVGLDSPPEKAALIAIIAINVKRMLQIRY